MAQQYTSKERVEALFARQEADRIPVILGLTVQLARQAGLDFNEARLDPEKAWKTFVFSEKLVPTDMPRVPASPYLPDVMQARQESVLGPEAQEQKRFANKAALDTFRYRPPKENRAYSVFLSMARRAVETFPDRPIFADLGGPWSIAADLRGIEQLIYDTVDDPEFVHRVMRVTTRLSLERALAMAETGVYVRIGDPSAGCSLISPRIYREFVKPYHRDQLFARLRSETHTRIGLHICGYVDPIMEDLLDLAIDWFEIDALSSLEKMVSLSQGKIVLRGQMPSEVLIDGTEDTIANEVKRCVDTAASRNPFMVGPGCSVPFTASLENIKHFVAAAHRYGSYDYINATRRGGPQADA